MVKLLAVNQPSCNSCVLGELGDEGLSVAVVSDLSKSGSDWPPNRTNPGLFQIRLQYIWLDEPNVLKSDLKKSRICPIWGPI